MNTCTCCGQRAEAYGTGWIGTNGSGDCSREVCTFCFEGGCSCSGNQLKEAAAETHDNCEHDRMWPILAKYLVRYDNAWRVLAGE